MARSRFVITTPSGDAELTYHREGNRIDFNHTYVPPAMRGRGLAETLVKAALAWANEAHLEVAASCSYVAKYLQAQSHQ